MKLRIYLSVEGQENLLRNQDLWPWQFLVRTRHSDDVTWLEPEPGSQLLLETEVTMPAREACIAPVLTALAAREQKIRADAQVDLNALNKRRQELLALPFVDATL